MARRSIFLALALVLAACGGGAHHRSAARSCTDPRAAADLARLRADVAAIRLAARRSVKDTLKGNARVNRATDRFLLDVGRAHVSLLVQNRFIDHAAAALVGTCQQCFQALEAVRPIPAISHAGRCG